LHYGRKSLAPTSRVYHIRRFNEPAIIIIICPFHDPSFIPFDEPAMRNAIFEIALKFFFAVGIPGCKGAVLFSVLKDTFRGFSAILILRYRKPVFLSHVVVPHPFHFTGSVPLRPFGVLLAVFERSFKAFCSVIMPLLPLALFRSFFKVGFGN